MSAAGGAPVEVEIRGPVVLVTLNRPETLNALDRELTAELARVTDRVETESSLRVAVTRGKGRAFCAGNDLKETATLNPVEAEAHAATQAGLFDHWAALPVITIAAVHGYALGGGLMMAASHDLRVVAEGARFGLPEITLGWPPAYGVQRLIHLLGEARAREMVLTGALCDAEEARRMGLVNRVVAADRLLDATLAWAEELAQLSRDGIRATKRVLTEIGGRLYRAEPQAFAGCLAGAEARDRIRTFMERRSQ